MSTDKLTCDAIADRQRYARVPEGLVQLDRDLADLVDGYLASRAVEYRRADEAGRVVFDIAPGAELAAELGDRRRFATGDARGLTDAEPLNLVHPLIRAAIAGAREWPGGSVELLLPRDANPNVAALAGKVGVLAVALVDYAGFEPVQRLIAGGVVDGGAGTRWRRAGTSGANGVHHRARNGSRPTRRIAKTARHRGSRDGREQVPGRDGSTCRRAGP